jgi:hypothetical protein
VGHIHTSVLSSSPVRQCEERVGNEDHSNIHIDHDVLDTITLSTESDNSENMCESRESREDTKNSHEMRDAAHHNNLSTVAITENFKTNKSSTEDCTDQWKLVVRKQKKKPVY